MRPVQTRSTGTSLHPIVQSGDVTIWEPVGDHARLEVGDIVFCRVQTSQHYHFHMIHKIDMWGRRKYWDIGNLRKPRHTNGYCYAEHIYGRLVAMSPVQPRRVG